MIREHIVTALNERAADAGEADEEMGPVEVLRGVVDGCARAGVTEVDVAELTWIADEMSGPPWPP